MRKMPFIILLSAVLFLSACTETGRVAQPAVQGETVKLHLVVEAYGYIVLDKEIEAEKGANAFDVMKANADLKYTEFEFGPFIEEIGGVTPFPDEFWALYVDGEMAMQGIASYTIDGDMEIKWKVETQQGFPG